MTEALLAEYKALRDEAMATYTRRASVQNLGTILFAGLQTAALTQHIPELSIAATALLLAFWSDEVRWIEAGAKIGAYIRLMIEPKIDGLQWETIIQQANDPVRQTTTLRSRLRLLSSRYPMTAFVGVALSVFLLCSSGVASVARIGGDIAVIVVCSVWAIGLFVVGTDYGAMHRRWEARFSEASQSWAEKQTNQPSKRPDNGSE